ncbi:MAG: 50S ribosomal protein L11, partial [Candidatus Diapherotrites archaeon]|nr:50S ribosomal protein L11 [Candidatus Diapherotrites archaeon]
MPELSLLIEGGKATAGPPLGPSLAPLGVNIGKVVADINAKTKEFEGIKVPVKLTVDTATKTYEIEVGSPPTSSLIRKELGLEKGSGNPKLTFVGNLTLAQLKKIAELKRESSSATEILSLENEVAGTADSMGVTVEGVRAKEFIAARKKAGKATSKDNSDV